MPFGTLDCISDLFKTDLAGINRFFIMRKMLLYTIGTVL